MSADDRSSKSLGSNIIQSGAEDDMIIKVEPVDCEEREPCSSTSPEFSRVSTSQPMSAYPQAVYPSMVSAPLRCYSDSNSAHYIETTSMDHSFHHKTAFDHFRNQILESIKVEYPNATDEEAYHIAAKRWNLLSEDQKRSFMSKDTSADSRASSSSYGRLRGLHYDTSGGSDESRKSEKDSTKFGKCTWCKKFGSLNDYSSNLQGREIYCTGLCSKNCFEQAALKILNVEAGYGLETSIYSDNFPIRTSLENLSRHQQQDARDRYKDGRPYDQLAHEGVRSRFDVSRLQAGIAKGSDVVRPNPIIASPPASLPTSGAIRVPMWNIENVRSMRSGEPMSSTKQDAQCSDSEVFDWDEYIKRTSSIVAPPSCFRQPLLSANPFDIGMKVELKDPKQECVYCIATVVGVIGSRIRLRPDGCSSRDDVWVFCDSRDMHPIGWCKEQGIDVQKPEGFTVEGEIYADFVQKTLRNGKIAPINAFRDEPLPPKQNEFLVGMKLEAVDKSNPSLIGVATVHEVDKDRIRIEFDGYKGSGYWTTYWDRDLLNAGWCHANGHPLKSPGFQVVRPEVVNPYTDAANARVSPAYTERNCRPMPNAGEVDAHINTGCDPGPFLDPKKVISLRSAYKGHIAVVLKVILEDLIRCAYHQKEVFGFLRPGRGNIQINAISDGIVYNCCLPNVDRVSTFWKVMEQFCDSLQCCSNLVSGFELQSPCPQCGRKSQYRTTMSNSHKRPSSGHADKYPCVSSTPDSTAVNVAVAESPKRRRVNTTFSQLITSPRNLSVNDVAEIMEKTDLKEYVSLFRDNDIDGKALLLLQRDIVINYMGLKIGPAVKLLDMIEELKDIDARFR